MSHSVENHLGTTAADYDRTIRTLIPGYEEMLSTIQWWLSRITPSKGKIVELGAGTGALAQAVLSALPEVQMELWDIDRQMIAVARERLRSFGDRVDLLERSFEESIGACDAVIATLSLHHITTLDAKRSVYTNVCQALSNSGIFLIGDCTMDLSEPAHGTMLDYWATFMSKQGISDAQARGYFVEWAKEDTYQQIADELTALRQAGFAHPEVFWKTGPIAVYGGIRT